MCPLAMALEGISVKKSVGTGGTRQLCVLMDSMYVRAYSCSRSGGSLCTSLNITVINVLCVTHIDSQGLHLSWYCFPCGLRNGQMRTPYTDTPSSGLGAIAADFWVVGLATVAVATLFHLGTCGPT